VNYNTNSMDVRNMISQQVQMFVDEVSSKVDGCFWQPLRPYPNFSPLKIDAILTYNNAFEHYVFNHRNEISDFQLDSVLSMLKCSTNECGGITYLCRKCNETKFIPFRCHSRVCPHCGKRYSKQWGRALMGRFFQGIIGM